MKIVQIIGARPQFIKYSPVAGAIDSHNRVSDKQIENILIHTGQHYDYVMSEIFFGELGIKDPHYNLGIGSGGHGLQTGQILLKVEEVLLKETPDAVLVYGDTNSTLGGALAAIKLHIPVAHVEAGLRSYNKYMPEEINRVLTDHSSSLLLCPTETAVRNLEKEGFSSIINGGKYIGRNFDLSSYAAGITNALVLNIGDVMYDVLLTAVEIAGTKSEVLKKLTHSGEKYYVLTLHRAENTCSDEKMDKIVDFVNDVSSGSPVIFPAHPRTQKALRDNGIKFGENIRMVEPLSYFDMLWLLKNSELVLTDSGGLQKEAYWLKVPCITLRDETEWVETVQSGWNILYRDYKGTHKTSDADVLLYGDGKAAERIVDAIIETIGMK